MQISQMSTWIFLFLFCLRVSPANRLTVHEKRWHADVINASTNIARQSVADLGASLIEESGISRTKSGLA